MIETILSYGSAIIIAIAAICTLVTVITELTKETGFLKKIPTVLQVVVLSELICIVTFLQHCLISTLHLFGIIL